MDLNADTDRTAPVEDGILNLEAAVPEASRVGVKSLPGSLPRLPTRLLYGVGEQLASVLVRQPACALSTLKAYERPLVGLLDGELTPHPGSG